MIFVIFLMVFIGIAGFSMLRVKNHNSKVIRRIASQYGEIPEWEGSLDDYESIKRYFNLVPPTLKIDDQTWKDLDMDFVFKQINATQSSIGEEVLFRRLRDQGIEDLEQFEKDVSWMSKHEAVRIQIQREINRIGKKTNNQMIELIMNPTFNHKQNFTVFTVLRTFAILSLFVPIFNRGLGVTLISFAFIINNIIYYSKLGDISTDVARVSMLVDMIKASKNIEKLGFEPDSLIQKRINKALNPFRNMGLAASLAASSLQSISSEAMALGGFIDGYFLISFGACRFMFTKIMGNKEETLELYESIGYLECVIATASYRQSQKTICTPTILNNSEINFVNLKNPLVEDAVGNSHSFQSFNMITGSNASGKSTFVKALAINILLGQTLNTCIADAMSFPHVFVITSMAIQDDINSKESYFVRETKSLKRILDEVKGNQRCFIVIDEILKGTNTIERIASSYAVLESLTNYATFVCAATHDLELTELLKSTYQNYHFKEMITDQDIVFDYKLREGPSDTRNAIKMLEYYGYEKSLIEQANRMADSYEKTRIWERHEA